MNWVCKSPFCFFVWWVVSVVFLHSTHTHIDTHALQIDRLLKTTTVSMSLSSEPEPWRPNSRPKLVPGIGALLLNLAQGVLWDILTEWLTLNCLCLLDSAMCAKAIRVEFLELIQTNVLRFNRDPSTVIINPALGHQELQWIHRRGVHLASIKLPTSSKSLHMQQQQQRIRELLAAIIEAGLVDKLESFDFRACFYIRGGDVNRLLSRCFKSIKFMYPDPWQVADHYWKLLRSLENIRIRNFLESKANIIVESSPRLKKIFVELDFPSSMTDSFLNTVAKHSRQLEQLAMQGCTQISPQAFYGLFNACVNLSIVDFCGTHITDDSVYWMSVKCPQLIQVYLGECSRLTVKAVEYISKFRPKITHIRLADNSWIEREGLVALVSACRDLEYINISRCPGVTSDSIIEMVQVTSCKLRDLYVRGIRNLSIDRVTPVLETKLPGCIMHMSS